MTDEATAKLEGDEIVLSFPYNLDTIDLVRDITGRKWDATRKVWVIPASVWHAQQVLSKLSRVFRVDPAIRRMATGSNAVPPRLRYPDGLYDFQKAGVKYVIGTGGRCIVADEMGLGKTIEALAYVLMFGGKTLIVAPANVIYKWRDEYQKWVPGKTVAVVKTGSEPLPDTDAVIMSFSIMTLQYPRLIKTPFDVGIWDEAHYLKNSKTQRTRVAKSLITAGLPKVLFLSGTPFMNAPIELFTLLNMLDPIGFNNYWAYATKYCGAMKIDGIFTIPKHTVTNVDELTKRLEKYMVRRTKRDVELELPDLTRSYVPVEIENMKAYLGAVRDVSEWLNSKGKDVKNKSHVLTRLGILRQIVGEGKVEAAYELAENILDAGRKVVLFAHHKSVVDSLYGKLRKRGARVIDGSTPSEDRLKFSKEFLISDSEIRVIIMSTAGAEGIDLYSASDIIFVEREWTPSKEEQAEARLHRIGQKNAVVAHYIVAAGTIDEKINKLIQDKRSVFGQVIHSDEILELVVEELIK
jgi:SWI/SNF-related matrix-associated actin-dependent regulator 1 of chromatin subfamily A